MASFVLAACTNTVSRYVDANGYVEPEDVIFPQLDKAWQKAGQFPNSENLSKIRSGMDKDELYQLIGRPHFSETHGAHEWDYIMKFYQPDESVKICQYKITFDREKRAQEFFWLPEDCVNYVKPLQPTNPMLPVLVGKPVVDKKINLSADTLFHFDKYKPNDMLPQGRQALNELAQTLMQYSQQGQMHIQLVGHTDRIGNDMYNMNLSLLRAQTVRSYLIERGIDAATITATGAGETQPVKQCADNTNKQTIIACLQPNRRVEVNVVVYAR